MVTKTDALLYAGDDIRVNSIHPGYIWTPIVADLSKASREGVDNFRRKLDSKHPIGPETIIRSERYSITAWTTAFTVAG